MKRWSMAIVVLLAGCASAGTKVDPDTVASFVKGRTTVAEAEDALGQPNAMSTAPDGTTVLVYSYAHSSVRAATFIPVVGMFAGGTDTKSQSVVLRFGTDGTYRDASSSAGQVGVTTGLAAP
jgi:hypothetical protein